MEEKRNTNDQNQKKMKGRLPMPLEEIIGSSLNGTSLSNVQSPKVEPGENKWVPYVMVGGLVVASIALAVIVVNRSNKTKND